MRIGVPKEIKVHEYRVGLTPASVAELVAHGHELFLETNAGNGINCPDSAYEKAGAKILPDAASVFKSSDMIVKVKEPQRANGPSLAKARSCSLTSILRRIPNRPRACSRPAALRSPMKPSPTRPVTSPCLRR